MEEYEKIGSILQYAVNEKQYKELVEEIRKLHDNNINGKVKVDTTPELEEIQFNGYTEKAFNVNIYSKKRF
jgi:Cu/Ag efflux pump CusA